MGKSIFIDIQEKELSAYIFEVKGNKYELKETKKYPFSHKNDFSIDKVTEDIENAYLSLPISSLNFRVIELPFSDKDRIREVLPFELDGMILGGSDKVVFDDIVVGKSNNTYQVLAVYIEKKIIGEILEKLKSHNIDPVSITCLELKSAVKDFDSAKLFSPIVTGDKDRAAMAVEEMKAPVIDLRRDEFSFTRDIQKTKKSLRITALLAVIIALVLSAGILVKLVSARYEIASLKNDMRKKYQEMFPGEKNIMNELLQVKSHLKELKGKEDLLVGINPLNVLSRLSQLERHGVVFNEITAGKDQIIMKGEAPSLSDIQELKGKLESLFNEVTLSDSKASAQGRMLFTITGKEKRV